jgi:hypothetical protein
VVERLEVVRLNRHDQINQRFFGFFGAGVEAAGDDGFAVSPGDEESVVAADPGKVDSQARSTSSSLPMLCATCCPRWYVDGPFMMPSMSAMCSRTARMSFPSRIPSTTSLMLR